MYSFAPWPDETAHTITMLILVTIGVCGGVIGMILISVDSAARHWRAWVSAGMAISSVIIGLLLNENKLPPPPKNIEVVGTLVGFSAEGYNERSGKSKADVHYMYVTYRVPEGDVMLRASQGNVYPARAILYRK